MPCAPFPFRQFWKRDSLLVLTVYPRYKDASCSDSLSGTIPHCHALLRGRRAGGNRQREVAPVSGRLWKDSLLSATSSLVQSQVGGGGGGGHPRPLGAPPVPADVLRNGGTHWANAAPAEPSAPPATAAGWAWVGAWEQRGGSPTGSREPGRSGPAAGARGCRLHTRSGGRSKRPG